MKINLQHNIKKARVITKLALSSKKQNLMQGVILIAVALTIDISIYQTVYNFAKIFHIYIGSAFGLDLMISLGFLIVGVGLVLKSFTNK